MGLLGSDAVVSDWSYRYGKPRSEVHEARYGTTETPPRRGMAGAMAVNGASLGLVSIGSGLLVIGLLLMRK